MSQKHMPTPNHNSALKAQDEVPKHLKLLWDHHRPCSLLSTCSHPLLMLALAQMTQLPDNWKDSMADNSSSKSFQKALITQRHKHHCQNKGRTALCRAGSNECGSPDLGKFKMMCSYIGGGAEFYLNCHLWSTD